MSIVSRTEDARVSALSMILVLSARQEFHSNSCWSVHLYSTFFASFQYIFRGRESGSRTPRCHGFELFSPLLLRVTPRNDVREWGASTAKGSSLLSLNREGNVRGKAPSPVTQMSKHRV
jgi:hypothetical protein